MAIRPITDWTIRAYWKPLISWIWGGALVMAFGGVVSLSDRRWRVGAATRSRHAVTAQTGGRRMKAGVRNLLFILPVLLFVALAGYFALALRPGYDPHELPSAMIDKEAPRFRPRRTERRRRGARRVERRARC